MNLTAPQKSLIDQFIALLQKWNATYNLTAITETDAIYTQHILDSLSIAPFIQDQRILDVGTGGGFPGIPLSIYFPDKHFTLLDSNGKKLRFLTQAIGTLGLKNVEIVHSRVEDYQSAEKFDEIVTRATLSTADLLKSTQHLIKPTGRWLLMKGQDPTPELQHLPQTATVARLNVPGLLAERHLLLVHPSTTPV